MSTSSVRLALLAILVVFTLGSACSPNNAECGVDGDCCGNNVCTPAPWEAPDAKLCLPAPPVCYGEGQRCAGAPGKEFVPYANCCSSDTECAEDIGLGWGKFCSSTPSRKKSVVALLKSLETGDPAPAAIINPNNYIQHNLGSADGLAGFAEFVATFPPGVTQDTIRIFEDGDFVFSHSNYTLFGPQVGFDVFRFEDGLIVEHWDNLQTRPTEPNPSGRTMLDGPTEAMNLDMTEANKAVAETFITDILINGNMDNITTYIGDTYIQHNPDAADGLDGLLAVFETFAKKGIVLEYKTVQKVLGEGNFVLAISEAIYGTNGGTDSAIYDLFRIEQGLIVEHWDVIQSIPPRDEWKNDNGKFGF